MQTTDTLKYVTTSTVEDYLKCIYQSQQGTTGLVATGHIAVTLKVAPGTVTAMMKTLAESDLAVYEPYSGVRLTNAGVKLAAHVLRRHRVVELFLVEIMGMNWSEVHGDAELLEHAVSDQLLNRMDEMLGGPDVDPHGDPIPTSRGVLKAKEYPSLLECPLRSPVKVARVTDQATAFLRLLERQGVMPGNLIEVESREEAADTVLIHGPGRKSFSLGFRPASTILVDPA